MKSRSSALDSNLMYIVGVEEELELHGNGSFQGRASCVDLNHALLSIVKFFVGLRQSSYGRRRIFCLKPRPRNGGLATLPSTPKTFLTIERRAMILGSVN